MLEIKIKTFPSFQVIQDVSSDRNIILSEIAIRYWYGVDIEDEDEICVLRLDHDVMRGNSFWGSKK